VAEDARIHTTPRAQALEYPQLAHAALVEHADQVRLLHGGQAVRDQDGRALAEEAAQLVEDGALGLGVDARERVVEDEHPRRCGEHARERDALLLPARERDAALADDRLEALGKLRQVARE